MIKNLRKYILQDLKTVHPNMFFDGAEDKAKFPYTVLELERVAVLETSTVFTLEVNTWNKHDLESVVDIGELINDKLTKYKRLESDMLIQIDPQGIFALINDTDVTLKRCRQLFDVRVTERRIK